MLGNFSFGDYFKAKAIKFAWEVSTEVFGLDANLIWPSVFHEDEEAFELWTQYVPAEKIVRFGEKENFWSMGDVGPCGPCSELLYDRGAKYGKETNPADNPDGERFLEFWNLVFMQYNRDANGNMNPLPKPSIDTGAGMERIVLLNMNVDSVFETDVLQSIINRVEEISGIEYQYDNPQAPAFRVIADHLRTLSFAIADGVQPSNLDRGYVLRKILRRAVRYGRTIGLTKPFLADVLPILIETMGDDYQELKTSKNRIAEIITSEEESFIRTLQRGGNILNGIIEDSKKQKNTISGDDAFKLKDTYGFPIEEILLIAKDANLKVDIKRYDILEQEAKNRSRKAHKTIQQSVSENLFKDLPESTFLGYENHTSDATIKAIVVENKFVTELHAEQEGIIILDKTPFYAERGGQVGDFGSIHTKDAIFEVTDCQTPFTGIIAHVGKLKKGSLNQGDVITATIDKNRRQKICNNHTTTHLLHWALCEVLGEHVRQSGSIVDPDRLRFDFSHHKALSQDEISAVEDLVNTKIRENSPVNAYECNYENLDKDIKQFFGDKYTSVVRVVDIDYSKELCGGTHTSFLGTIGYFRIAKEGSIAAGIRRIEALTGHPAELLSRQSDEKIHYLASTLKCPIDKIENRIEKLLEENKESSHQIKKLQKDLIKDLINQKRTIKGFEFLALELSTTPKELKILTEELFNKISSGVLIIAAKVGEDKTQIIIKVTEDITKTVKANELIKELAPIIDGRGGGKPHMAQAGGSYPEKLGEVITKANQIIN